MAADMAAAVGVRTAVVTVGPVVARMSLAAAGTVVVVTGTAVAGMAGVVAGITVVAVVVGELALRSVSVLALDSSEEH